MTLSVSPWNAWWTGTSGSIFAAISTVTNSFRLPDKKFLLDSLGITVPCSVCLHLVTPQCLQATVVWLLLFCIFYIVFQCYYRSVGSWKQPLILLTDAWTQRGRKQPSVHWALLVVHIPIFHALFSVEMFLERHKFWSWRFHRLGQDNTLSSAHPHLHPHHFFSYWFTDCGVSRTYPHTSSPIVWGWGSDSAPSIPSPEILWDLSPLIFNHKGEKTHCIWCN